ncbi:ArsR/SmtB family transcription factor [Kineococcus sp. LSe6-4]|uniref:ArsR/SmtB family transcription factor n=1 Tax=Kineococcus halophytocola TaxID=3234027 RepID=A0ABV4GWN5_9ACTN
MNAGLGKCSLGVASQYVDLAAEVFSLLSDPTRIRIVLALRAGETSVNELADLVGKSPTAVSQHLAKLRWGRVVTTRQDGNRVFYRLADEHARTLVAEAVSHAEHALEPRTAHQRAGVAPGAGARVNGQEPPGPGSDQGPDPRGTGPGTGPATGAHR